MSGILGLDLSLTGSAAVYIPEDWELCDWDSLVTLVVGQKHSKQDLDSDRIDRLAYISDKILELAAMWSVEHVFIENYGYSMGFQSHQLGELGGVVRLRFAREQGIYPVSVPCSAARALLFGKDPRKKELVIAGMKSAGIKFKTKDEYDALVIANYGLSAIGKPAVMFGGAENGTKGNARRGSESGAEGTGRGAGKARRAPKLK